MRTQLNGYVVGDEDLWLYQFFEIPAFSPQSVRDALSRVADGEELVFEINSGGGSVFAGFEIYSILRTSGKRTVAEIQSLAASAASTIMLGCDEVVASPVAQVMIHLPSVVTNGDRYDHQDSIGILDSITRSILNAYTLKCWETTSRDELLRLMRAESWLTAPEAQQLGLVDRIIGQETIDPAAILNCAGSFRNGVQTLAAQPMPDPMALRQRYDALVSQGKAPARDGAAVLPLSDNNTIELQVAKARLDLEKMRF